jgi:hypothetical protein
MKNKKLNSTNFGKIPIIEKHYPLPCKNEPSFDVCVTCLWFMQRDSNEGHRCLIPLARANEVGKKFLTKAMSRLYHPLEPRINPAYLEFLEREAERDQVEPVKCPVATE